jgi:uncharacterized membrane protein YhhN
VAVVAALANWWSRWRDHRPTEVWSKPLTLLALIGVAVALDPVDPTVRVWFVVALVLSLAGDVFLLGGDRWFVAGLGSFLLGHLAYVVGFAVGRRGGGGLCSLQPHAWWCSHSRSADGSLHLQPKGDRKLRVPVAAYLGVISMMVMSAAAVWNAWALLGAVTFLVSDTVLGWRQFVERAAVDAGDDHGDLPPRSGGLVASLL